MKKTTHFKPTNVEDVVNKACLDEKFTKIDGHLSSFLDKEKNEFKIQYNKQSVEEVLVQRALKTTIQII